MDKTSYIGIDIARNKFDAVIYKKTGKPRHKVFANNLEGFTQLLQWVNTPAKNLHIGMEATNTYWEDLAYFLKDQGSCVSVINPKCLKKYGESQNMRCKTDKTDAAIIARYTAKEQPEAWKPQRHEERTLLLQMRQLEHMKQCEQKERVRISMMKDAASREVAKRIADYIQTEIVQLEKQIAALIHADKKLNKSAQLLKTVPGIGAKTLPWLVAYLGDGSRFKNGKAAATYAGLTPIKHDSGDTVAGKTKISKIGHSEIRKAMYMPAMIYGCGRMKDGVFRAFTQRLRVNGKCSMEIITALMRKMLCIAQAVLKSGQPFNPELHEKSFNNA